MNHSKPAFTTATRRVFGAAAGFGLFVLLAMVLSGCNLGGDPDYLVRFTLDGTDYELTGGYKDNNDFDLGANGAKSDSSARLYIGAVKSTVADMDSEGPFIYMRVDEMTPGIYGAGDCSIYIAVDGAVEYSTDSALTVNLDCCLGIGEAIEGTFSGEVKEGLAAPSVDLDNGYFYVERLADGSIAAPDRFR